MSTPKSLCHSADGHRGQDSGGVPMDTLQRGCAGLDVPKDAVGAGVRRLLATAEVVEDIRRFGTTTAALLRLLDWLLAAGVPIVAMESTGVYWQPIVNVVEGHGRVLLVNAAHVQQVAGCTTAVTDGAWIAQLVQYGLRRPSCVPEQPVRELRDLTRQRTPLTGERSAAANRIQKVLEDANIKLGSVASDVLGVSGRAMLAGLIEGPEDPEVLAQQARGRLRAKLPQWRAALRGRVTAHHRFWLRLHLDHVAHLDELLACRTERIDHLLFPPSPDPGPVGAAAVPAGGGPRPTGPAAAAGAGGGLGAAVVRLMTVRGIHRRTAAVVVAEIGADMGKFPTAGHLASGAGLCPGNHESAGKRHSGKVRRGNWWLKQALVQAAWAASRSRKGSLAALHRRLARRRGQQRALRAVAPALRVTCYHLLRQGEDYRDPAQDSAPPKPRAEVAGEVIFRRA